MTAPALQAVAKSPAALSAFRISAADSNYFACLADPLAEGAPFTIIVEIYEPGGATPPNTHSTAWEHFFILEGTGKGYCDGVAVDLGPGASLLIPPGKEHVVQNTGAGKLYALTTMVPNEGFAELIRGGIPVELAPEDIAVLTRALPSAA
jgi:mannose-6-phosphate isomerase-like protein (cupin superfamily)